MDLCSFLYIYDGQSGGFNMSERWLDYDEYLDQQEFWRQKELEEQHQLEQQEKHDG